MSYEDVSGCFNVAIRLLDGIDFGKHVTTDEGLAALVRDLVAFVGDAAKAAHRFVHPLFSRGPRVEEDRRRLSALGAVTSTKFGHIFRRHPLATEVGILFAIAATVAIPGAPGVAATLRGADAPAIVAAMTSPENPSLATLYGALLFVAVGAGAGDVFHAATEILDDPEVANTPFAAAFRGDFLDALVCGNDRHAAIVGVSAVRGLALKA